MTPTSDLDVLAITRRPLTADQRQHLVESLLTLSVPPQDEPQDGDARPIELTIAAQGDVRPWRFPPVMDFQFGDWLRPDIERGTLPERAVNPDLAILIAIAWRGDAPLLGRSARQVLDPVPDADIRVAMREGLSELSRTIDKGTDDRNVLLTLARIWMTSETTEIARKDVAATWAAERLDPPARDVMRRAGELYVAGRYGPWAALEPHLKAAAALVTAKILSDTQSVQGAV